MLYVRAAVFLPLGLMYTAGKGRVCSSGGSWVTPRKDLGQATF